MATLAKRLPVAFIPKEPHVASVRNNVIYHCRWAEPPLPQALRAQRVLAQKTSPRGAPATAITALCGVATKPVSGKG